MYCYSNDGTSMRTVPDNYTTQTGEVLFTDIPQSSDLSSSFPNYTVSLASVNKERSNAPILAQITLLEAQQARAVREVLCGMTASQTYLTTLNTQITALRGQLQ